MRQHAYFSRLAPRINAEAFHEIVAPEHLVFARLDPGISGKHEGLLDLVFVRDGRVALVPFILVQGLMLVVRESSPLVWPAWLPPLRSETARGIEDRLEPWLHSLVIAHFQGDEEQRLFGDDKPSHALVRAAREAGFLGAAASDGVMRSIAPYVYAQRFVKQRRVVVVDRSGANGATIIARTAACVDADVEDDALASLARRWFDLDIFRASASGGNYDVAIGARERCTGAGCRVILNEDAAQRERIVEVARPIVPSVSVSFDLDDGDAVGRFAIAAPEPPLRGSSIADPRVVGGSSGRIGIVVRDDYARRDDADIDAARATAARLCAQGFEASLVAAGRVAPEEFDLLHFFGSECARSGEAALAQAAGRGVPIVVTPYADDAAGEASWGAGISLLTLRITSDVAGRERYASAVAERKLDAPSVPSRSATPGRFGDLRTLLQGSAAAIVSSPDEERRLREIFAFGGATRVVPALLGPEIQPAAIGSLVGAEPFVLVHAPVEPRCNQFAILQAAATLGFPLVLTGPVADAEYYGELVRSFGDGAVWLPGEGLSPGEVRALYARARVFADVSWCSGGLYRLARAGGFGAALLATSSGYARSVWPGLVQIVDPASAQSITTGLRVAWERAPEAGPATAARTAQVCDPFAALVATLAAYEKAAAREPS